MKYYAIYTNYDENTMKKDGMVFDPDHPDAAYGITVEIPASKNPYEAFRAMPEYIDR